VSVRLRLAALFVAVLAVLVLATSAITYTIVRADLHTQLVHSAQRIARIAARGEPGELRLEGLAGPGDRIWLTDASGRVVRSTAGAPGDSMDGVRAAVHRAPGGYVTARHPRADGGQVVVLLSNHSVRATLSTLLRTLLAAGLGILAVAGVLGGFLAWRALRPVDRMRQQVDDIPGDALDRRITEGRPDELGRLARAFNRLLERAEYAAEQQQRFVADASHELKTPVTALQGHARIIARSVEREEWGLVSESADVIVRETRRLSSTVAELLSLAEAGSQTLRAAPVRLDAVAEEACDEMRALDPDRPLETLFEATSVSGDPGRLGELVRVLVDNALKYSPPGEPVTVTVNAAAGPTLAVRDRGPGLSPEDRERAFDRFYRGSAAGLVPGSGLGLAIAQAICERHRAVLTLEPAVGGGTVATVRFPAPLPGPEPAEAAPRTAGRSG
jgi:two-component system, OmpR family, sensor histidine kinase MprB